MKIFLLLIGNLGFYTNNLNGQTMRTRTVLEAVITYLNKEIYKVDLVDTSISGNKLNIIVYYSKGIIKYFISRVIILMPAQSAIRLMAPMVYYLNFFTKKEIHFIAIGGWIGEFLEKKTKYIKYLSNFKYIYVQTETLKSKLEKLGLGNVVYFPNFRFYEKDALEMKHITEVNKIVLFSRVTKEKGVEIAIESIQNINNNYKYNIELHIYGPIEKKYKESLNAILEKTNYISYKGVLQPNTILDELSKYDLLIFPSYYEGEGFPGTILDSISAGVPVIASDWKYNSEIVRDGYTGLLFENKNIEDLTSKICMLVNNVDLLNQMKINCILESEKYKESNVVPILINNILQTKK